MGLRDYTYIAALGHSCMPTYQVFRAAESLGMPLSHCMSPFDWLGIRVEPLIDVVERDFAAFFDPRRVRVEGIVGGMWHVVDASGAISWHHLPAIEEERAPGALSWFTLGQWLGARLEVWRRALRDPSGRVLFVRTSNPDQSEESGAIDRLAESLSRHVAGDFCLASLSFAPPARPAAHDRVREIMLMPTWPSTLPLTEVDWERDYGRGRAWQGSDRDWDAVFADL